MIANKTLRHAHGHLLVVRPPTPVTVNKAGANYKSEVKHLEYSPRRAFDEWTKICETILDCGGDALFQFEEVDEPFLGSKRLAVHGDGSITVEGSKEALGNISSIQTGRVFTANGPWVVVNEDTLTAVLPNMLAHRKSEKPYYVSIAKELAQASNKEAKIVENPHRWEGMADVAMVGDQVVLTYAVPGHYDEGLAPKSKRSSREGVSFAADHAGVPEDARIYVELIYPHFHGDTVHFGARPKGAPSVLVHYSKGLWGDGAETVANALRAKIVQISKDDAVEQYAGNSRQVNDGVLVPDGVSDGYIKSVNALGLETKKVPLFELFGKAGGGPGCATLYLPDNLNLPPDHPWRYSNQREAVAKRREKLAESVTVSPEFFAEKQRG